MTKNGAEADALPSLARRVAMRRGDLAGRFRRRSRTVAHFASALRASSAALPYSEISSARA